MSGVTVLVTGSAGFIGEHVTEALGRRLGVRAIGYDLNSRPEALEAGLAEADFIFHLAGVNRPQDPQEFRTGNTGFTEFICARLRDVRLPGAGRQPTIVLASSVQAALDNPYGASKRQAEEALRAWSRETGGRAVIFRLKNVFGKWCRPNYNSVVATFCHNVAHDLPISISDPDKELELVYIDDVVKAFLEVMDVSEGPRTRDQGPRDQETTDNGPGSSYGEIDRSFKVTLGELAAKLRLFREWRKTLVAPSMAEDFTRCLYATYLSYLDGPDFAYGLDKRTDSRGELAEFMKSEHFGQIFVSRTKPGIARGNHYHHTKTEKFLVLEGEGVIRFRRIAPEAGARGPEFSARRSEVIEHRVSGRDFRVVDIPPGYTHSIENVGNTEMVVLFWASEIFDPGKPDTFAAPVLAD